MLFTDGGLWEWNGVMWTNLPQANPPPTWATPQTYYSYGNFEYDEKWGKIVLFGRYRSGLGGTGGTLQATMFEWDPVNDWIQLPSTGPLGAGPMWFDRHRGTMMVGFRPGSALSGFYCRDAARNWVPFQSGSLPLQQGCHDAAGNRYFFQGSAATIGIVQDTHPAAFAAHAQGCTPPTGWLLDLTAPWTRAWIGQTLSVDVTAPYSLALLATGFSDQVYGSTPLPVNLGPYGLPGCSLRVAPEATVLGSSLSGTVTFSVPIPNAVGLLGVAYWQQSLALAIGSNPANLLATDSVRGTVGLYR
jgi:hypothetical protein